jgi:RNA 2',3'-cyclic 3'-phosphodiesterase
MARAFVAVQPPAAVLDAVESVVGALGDDVAGARWTTREQRHLTLQFLGNRADVDAVAAALSAVTMPAHDVALAGAGAFPTPRRARVLWAGVADGVDWLAQLASEVGARLAPLGYEPESRVYRPHLTLARWKEPTDVRTVVDAIGDAAMGEAWSADAIVWYESVLRREGAHYAARAVVPLGPGAEG